MDKVKKLELQKNAVNIRKDIVTPTAQMKEEGYKYYNLDANKKTVFVVGGSLGCRTLNNWVKGEIERGDSDY